MSLGLARSGLPHCGQEYASRLAVAPQAGHGIKLFSLMSSFQVVGAHPGRRLRFGVRVSAPANTQGPPIPARRASCQQAQLCIRVAVAVAIPHFSGAFRYARQVRIRSRQEKGPRGLRCPQQGRSAYSGQASSCRHSSGGFGDRFIARHFPEPVF